MYVAQVQVAFFVPRIWHNRHSKLQLFLAIFTYNNVFLPPLISNQPLNPPLAKPGNRLIDSFSFQWFTYFFEILGSTQVMYVGTGT